MGLQVLNFTCAAPIVATVVTSQPSCGPKHLQQFGEALSPGQFISPSSTPSCMHVPLRDKAFRLNHTYGPLTGIDPFTFVDLQRRAAAATSCFMLRGDGGAKALYSAGCLQLPRQVRVTRSHTALALGYCNHTRGYDCCAKQCDRVMIENGAATCDTRRRGKR